MEAKCYNVSQQFDKICQMQLIANRGVLAFSVWFSGSLRMLAYPRLFLDVTVGSVMSPKQKWTTSSNETLQQTGLAIYQRDVYCEAYLTPDNECLCEVFFQCCICDKSTIQTNDCRVHQVQPMGTVSVCTFIQGELRNYGYCAVYQNLRLSQFLEQSAYHSSFWLHWLLFVPTQIVQQSSAISISVMVTKQTYVLFLTSFP